MPLVVSVINYKGGVGKTTLTANIGTELARRGRRVLLIDLDPQASLTFSFYEAKAWERQLADERTILQWFGTVLDGTPASLRKYVDTPPIVNSLVSQHSDGRLDLIASHLNLVDVDLDFAALLGGSRFQKGSPRFVPLHRSLADALADPALDEYEVVLIDCAPNFTMVTRTGIVASEHLVVPAKPDYLSTLGIDYLRQKLSELVGDYNRVVGPGPGQINPTILGVIVTMIQYAGTNPIIAARNYIDQPGSLEIPVFHQTIRESKTLFAPAGETGIPAVLAADGNPTVQYELQELTSEFLAKIRN